MTTPTGAGREAGARRASSTPPSAAGTGGGRTRRWDERYAREGVAAALRPPHPVVAETVRALDVGHAVDLACGAGRHALLLASLGWEVDAVDLSATGLGLGRSAPGGQGVRWHLADALPWLAATPCRPDLVLASFVRLPALLTTAAARLATGGTLLSVGPAQQDAGLEGVPRDRSLLHDVTRLAREASAAGLVVVRAEDVPRPGGGHDAVLVVHR